MSHWNFDISQYIGHVELPLVCDIVQVFQKEEIPDIHTHLSPQIESMISDNDLRDKRIAIAVGSRGINGLVDTLLCIIDILKRQGAKPFIFPAMGSHAGATASGQKEYLDGLGVSENSLGVPVLSSMDTVLVDRLADGSPIYCDAAAAAADGIVVVNKVRPHANFKGDIESGLCKMLAIGMGKREGAATLHAMGYESFPGVLASMAEVLLKKLSILFSVAIVENAYNKPMVIEAIEKTKLISREKELLRIAKEHMPRFLTGPIDVLIVDQIGKNISGQGMDPNVTGRSGSPVQEGFDNNLVDRIVVLGLTEQTHGNFVGLGMSDISTIQVAQNLDFRTTYINEITSRTLPLVRLPFLAGNDLQAIQLACYACSAYPGGNIGLVHIKDTNNLERIQVSEKILKRMNPDHYALINDADPCFSALKFENGRLISAL